MEITFDPAKRDRAIAERGLDFADAAEVFAGPTIDDEDKRFEYGERRMICFGYLNGRMVMVCYVQRGETRHVFSMRKANERKQAKNRDRLL